MGGWLPRGRSDMARTLEARLLDLLEIEEGDCISPEVALFILDLNQLIEAATQARAFIGCNGIGVSPGRAQTDLYIALARAAGEF